MTIRSSTHRAFTPVGLLVVTGVIALFVPTLLPPPASAGRAAQRPACMSNLRQIGLAVTLYANDHRGFMPAGDDTNPPVAGVWFWMGRGFRPALEPYLPRGTGAGVFWCPGDEIATNRFDSTSYAYAMTNYHSPEQINLMTTVGHNYLASLAMPPIPQRLAAIRQSSQKILAGEWNANHERLRADPGWFGRAGSRVFVFADNHCEYLSWEQIIPGNDGLPNPNTTIDGLKGKDVR